MPKAARAAPPDPDFARLFAASESRLGGEAATRRNATISHLRAAVAARRATGGDGADDDGEAGWRGDLSLELRPAASDRVVEGRALPPPLVLVPGQRVAEPPPQPCPADFARFAAERGAATPRERVRTAVAFLSATADEGAVARAALLETVARGAHGLDRESALTAIGQLLREGALRGAGPGLYAARDPEVGA